jgi:transcriptional regulator with XRE-family HTH domain
VKGGNDLNTTLKELRVRKKLLQRDVAKKCNITPTYLYLLETGARSPSVNLIYKLCSVYNCDIRTLFSALQVTKRKYESK